MHLKIINPHRHLAPILAIALTFLVVEWLWRYTNPPLSPQNFRGFTSLFVLLAAGVWTLALPRRCQHLWWSLNYGAFIGAGVVGTPIVMDALDWGPSLALLNPRAILSFTAVCIVGAPTGAAALLVGTAVYRWLGCKHVDQDGSMCPNCGYCVSHLPSNRCPECGKEFSPEALGVAIIGRMPDRSFGRRSAISIAVLSVALFALIIAGRELLLLPPNYVLWNEGYWRVALATPQPKREGAISLMSGLLNDEVRSGRNISAPELHSILGLPDLFLLVPESGIAAYAYYYRDRPRPKNRWLAYFEFHNGTLQSVGWNAEEGNDHSKWSLYTERMDP
jgi:hypothetical protein